MRNLLQDLRYAFRQMWKAPGFTVVVLLSVALGIGATTAVFSVVYAVLLHPYPFRDWDRLIVLTYRDASGNIRCCLNLNGKQLQELRRSESIEGAVGFVQHNLVTTGGDLPEEVRAIAWTPNASSYFGVPPALGRGLIPSDAQEGQEPQPVVVLAYSFWQGHFGSDPAIIGKSLQLDHMNYKIVGVASSSLKWANGDVYLPLKIPGDLSLPLDISLRLKPGISPQAASTELQPLLETFARETPASFPKVFQAHIRPLAYNISTSYGPPLYLLLGAVCLLLLIGCLNVLVLLFARGTKRKYELSIRVAIGAARNRIFRQLLTESLALALVGETLGVVLAYVLQHVLVQQLPGALSVRQSSVHLSLPVLLFSNAVTLLTTVVFGLLPAVQFSRNEVMQSMQLGTHKIAGGWGRHTRNGLIVSQLALSLVLLAAATSSIRAFLHLMQTDMGYDPHNTAALIIPVHPNSYTTWPERSAYFNRLQQKLASTPGVDATAITTEAVPPFGGLNMRFEIRGENLLGDQHVSAGFVTPQYFGVLHVPILQGRLWDETEARSAEHLAVINRAMAKQYWPDGSPLHHQIRLPELLAHPPQQLTAPGSDDWVEIIGVVGDVRNDGIRNPVRPSVYLPYTFYTPTFVHVLVRTRSNPLTLLPVFRAQVQIVDSEQQIRGNVHSLEEWITIQDDWQQQRAVALFFSVFSIGALLLAGVGLYSVVSYSVMQRTTEFAVRMALGAQRWDVLLNVLLSTAGIVAIGVAAGIGLYLIVARVLAQWTHIPLGDTWIALLVIPLLLVVAILASYLPARRAMSIDPIRSLHYE
jgi:predicted permease